MRGITSAWLEGCAGFAELAALHQEVPLRHAVKHRCAFQHKKISETVHEEEK